MRHHRPPRRRPARELLHRRLRSVGALAAGAAALALVVACAALAWAPDSPLTPGLGGRADGDTRLAWAFLACAGVAAASYAFGVLVLERRPPPRLAAVAALAAAIQLAPLGAPLLLSSDAWTYWAYGRIAAVHGGNPYRDVPADVPEDAAYPRVGSAWRETPSVYGPAFTLASEPLALAADESPSAAAWLYKGLAGLAIVGAALLAARVSRRPALALAVVGWNPVLALHLAGGGHNDAWVAALLVAALALSSSDRRVLAGGAWAAAALVKWVPLALLPLYLLAEWRRARPLAPLAIGLGAVAAAVAGLATLRYGPAWLGAAGPLARTAAGRTRFALPSRLESIGVPEELALAASAVGLAAVYAWLAWQAYHGRARLALAAGAILVATPYLTPWYLAWVVPLAAAEDDRTARWLGVALTAYLVPQTVPV